MILDLLGLSVCVFISISLQPLLLNYQDSNTLSFINQKVKFNIALLLMVTVINWIKLWSQWSVCRSRSWALYFTNVLFTKTAWANFVKNIQHCLAMECDLAELFLGWWCVVLQDCFRSDEVQSIAGLFWGETGVGWGMIKYGLDRVILGRWSAV
jgi:hypothetical protein